jgi:hypothetical protein
MSRSYIAPPPSAFVACCGAALASYSFYNQLRFRFLLQLATEQFTLNMTLPSSIHLAVNVLYGGMTSLRL